MTIRPAQNRDLPAYLAHIDRLIFESGRDGDLIHSPVESSSKRNNPELLEAMLKNWQTPVTEVGWHRTWVLTEADGTVRGNLEIVHRPPIATCLHRGTLMMGIERAHRGQGHGWKMMEGGLAWAKAQPSLRWLSLEVFEHNLPARKLYARFGFEEVGTVRDMFRVFGQEISNITMVLRL